jgi:hypothetical protein
MLAFATQRKMLNPFVNLATSRFACDFLCRLVYRCMPMKIKMTPLASVRFLALTFFVGVFASVACGGKKGAVSPESESSASAESSDSPAASAIASEALDSAPSSSSSSSASASSTAEEPASTKTVECHAKKGKAFVELMLTLDNDTGKGTLSIGGKSKSVVAQISKGVVLVDAAGTKKITGKVATVTTEGKKSIRLGKQKALDCN